MGQYNPDAPAEGEKPEPAKKKKRGGRYRGKTDDDRGSVSREQARSNTRKALGQNLQLVALLLADVYPSHVGPIAGYLAQGFARTNASVPEEEHRRCLCVHLPTGKVVCWVITVREVETYFPHVPTIDESHWDRAKTTERTARLAEYGAWLKARPTSEPHKIGMDAPTPENDPVGRFRSKATPKRKAGKKR